MSHFRFKQVFAVALVAMMALTVIGSVHGAPVSQELANAQQSSLVGGSACEFAGGVSVGLGIAGLFGCVICGGGSLVLSVGALIMC